MFGMLRSAFTLLICILLVGIYLGWFTFHRAPADPKSNNVDINVSVDKQKMGADLQTLEQKVAKRIQDMNSPPPNAPPPQRTGQPPSAPRLNFGPLSVQSNGQGAQSPYEQNAAPSLSVGPISIQPSSQPSGRPNGQSLDQPQLRLQTQDYQFTVPLSAPPPGEGR